MKMENFWDSSVWGGFSLITVLLIALLVGNLLKNEIRLLRVSLVPTSVLAGLILLVVAEVFRGITGEGMFDTDAFGGNGSTTLEVITYHSLALGFIASAMRTSGRKLTGKRSAEIFDTGVTTVSTYLLQGVSGMAITLVASLVMVDFFPAAGVLLPFGYGQGTGQALNFGSIYETQYGFEGGRSFGLTIAACGFLSAALGGVFHLNLLRRRGVVTVRADGTPEGAIRSEEIQSDDEVPMQGMLDKLTIQVSLVAISYLAAYLVMYLLGSVLPGMKSTIFGFNFLLGVVMAALFKLVLGRLRHAGAVKKVYTNNFLLTRIGNFFFDIMVVAGIAAIRLSVLERYWMVIAILAVVGITVTYLYNRFVATTLFREYPEEQFLAMFGMLTGTASTGVVLLREIDPDLATPVADNLVYQNFPAMVFGFPMMLLATLAPVKPVLTLGILTVFLIAMNIVLFRRQVFRRFARRHG